VRGSMWSDLTPPWQACVELAWEAYCNDCIPIGAVVTDADGNILTRGRNRIYERQATKGKRNGDELAHAEMDALYRLDFDAVDLHSCVLYTTTEPCPMCMGTFYMSGVRTLHYASRDPWAGSVNLLGATWYLSRKPIKVLGPADPVFESVIVALFVDQDCNNNGGVLPAGQFYARIGEVFSDEIELGQQLCRSGELSKMRRDAVSVEKVFNRLASLVK
jgi:tRNA(Arg) A34 adenosine deaminase TadA